MQGESGRPRGSKAPLLTVEGLGIPLSGRVSVTGLPPAARALLLLSIYARTAEPLSIVCRSAEAETLVRDLRGFAGQTGVLDESAITLFAPLEADPYDGLSAHLRTVCRRVKALWGIMQGGAGITIFPVRSLLLPLPPLSLLRKYFQTIRVGEVFSQADDAEWFLTAGYRRSDLVTEPGDYSRRGGILDLYLPIADEPIRVELDGNVVASLRHFDPASQRSTRRLEEATLSPASETILEPAMIKRLRDHLANDEEGADLAERLETSGTFPGIEACARLLYPETSDPLGLVSGTRIVCDELEMALQELRQERADFLRAGSQAGGLPPADALMTDPGPVESALESASLHLRQLAIEDTEEAGRTTVRFHAAAMTGYRNRLAEMMDFIRAEGDEGRSVWLTMTSEGRTQRMRELLEEHELEPREAAEGRGGLFVQTLDLSSGFTFPEAALTVIAEREIFGSEPRHRKKSALPAFTSDFRDLDPGDLVVHVDHGVGRYEGLTRVTGDGQEIDVMVLSYQGEDKLFVPATRLDLVQKYSGAGGKQPTLEKLGGTGWVRTKQKVKKAMQDMAADLLNLYAARKTIEGHAAGPDNDWQREFEASFPYELTIDQQIAVTDIKRDLESSTPMDRLLCGDVGFGKTEVAMRAAFKVVMEGKQVAVLAPTTVLVFQHLNTFRERFAAFPTRIESLSRFRTPREQKKIVADLKAGLVDIIIGTHRMLSKDVLFKDLGLLVVDEEQRFGVSHKERIKKLRRNVDVLTMTATPIPRTLQMSLMGVRDLSVIETPPENRLAIQTHLVPYRDQIIESAIRHELERSGQIYFVHNRVDSVYAMAAKLKKLVPEAEFGVGHGQMPERDLEETMLRFLKGEFDVLVSTTIIENGLDIPRVNTLLVNRADAFGLSQLYQLRGRIGRSDRQAYAYLMVPPERTLTEVARKRLKVLQEFSDLGSGFRIAAMDLEIRGAGNLLGPAQHGQIAALGFELYCRMLERTIQELQGGASEIPEFRTSINLGIDLMIPRDYIEDEHHRLMFYKRIASATSREDLDRIRDEMEDRYGRLPRQGLNLLDVAGLRLLAEQIHVQQFDYRSGQLIARFSEASPVDPERLLAFVSRRTDATFSPPAVLRVMGASDVAERLMQAREILTSLA